MVILIHIYTHIYGCKDGCQTWMSVWFGRGSFTTPPSSGHVRSYLHGVHIVSRFWGQLTLMRAYFFIACLSWLSCQPHLNSIGQATRATQVAYKEIKPNGSQLIVNVPEVILFMNVSQGLMGFCSWCLHSECGVTKNTHETNSSCLFAHSIPTWTWLVGNSDVSIIMMRIIR